MEPINPKELSCWLSALAHFLEDEVSRQCALWEFDNTVKTDLDRIIKRIRDEAGRLRESQCNL